MINISSIVMVLTLINFAFQLDFVILMPLGKHVMDAFHITSSEYSQVVSVYTFSSGVSSLIFSLFAGQINKKRVTLIVLALLALSSYCTGVASGYKELLMIRLLSGVFAGILNPLIFALAGDHIPAKRRGKAMGLILTGFSIASVIGIPIGLYLTGSFGFPFTFQAISLFFFFTFLMSALLIPGVKKTSEKITFSKKIAQLKSCLINPRYFQGYSLLFLISGAIFVIVPLLTPFAMNNLKVTNADLQKMYFVGGLLTIFTSRIIGLFCDKKGAKKLLFIVSVLSIFPAMVFVHSGEVGSLYFILVGSLMMATMSGMMVPSMTISSFIPARKDSGIYNGILNSMRNLGAAVFTYFSGIITVTDTTSGKFTNFHLMGIIYLILIIVIIFLGVRIEEGEIDE